MLFKVFNPKVRKKEKRYDLNVYLIYYYNRKTWFSKGGSLGFSKPISDRKSKTNSSAQSVSIRYTSQASSIISTKGKKKKERKSKVQDYGLFHPTKSYGTMRNKNDKTRARIRTTTYIIAINQVL